MKAFDCKKCGDCCYGKGGIFMDRKERERIALFLEMSTDNFLARFCEERNGRIYARTGADNFCVFYRRGEGCAIHPVKPWRCSLWPYYSANLEDEDTWNTAKLACRGINRECSFDEFVREGNALGKNETLERPGPDRLSS